MYPLKRLSFYVHFRGREGGGEKQFPSQVDVAGDPSAEGRRPYSPILEIHRQPRFQPFPRGFRLSPE